MTLFLGLAHLVWSLDRRPHTCPSASLSSTPFLNEPHLFIVFVLTQGMFVLDTDMKLDDRSRGIIGGTHVVPGGPQSARTRASA